MTYALDANVRALSAAIGEDIGELRRALAVKSNFTADRAPLPSDDETAGYVVGSRWLWQGRQWIFTAVGWVECNTAASPQQFGWSQHDAPSVQRAALQAMLDAERDVYHIPAGVYTIDAALVVRAGNTTIRGDGSNVTEIRLADGVQRQNVIECVGLDGVAIADLAVIHNGDRGGDFSRHAPAAALTANSGLTVSGGALSGASSVTLTAATVTGSVNGGDTLSIGGEIYTVTNTVAAADNTLAGVEFTPPLSADAAGGTSVGVYQLPRYQAKTSYPAGADTITLDVARLVANPAPFAATRIRVGETFQFHRRVPGTLNSYEIDPENTTVYTVVGSDVSPVAAGIGTEFQNIQISPPLTAPVASDQYITSIQDANNRYSCGIYLGETSKSSVRRCRIYGTPMHGILVGTGPITAYGYSGGGDDVAIESCTIEYFGGNAIAGAKTTSCRVRGNRIKENYTGVGNGVQFDGGCDNSSVTANSIESVNYGVMVYAAKQISIAGNSISIARIGILSDATSSGNAISGNTIIGDANSARGVMIRKGDIVDGLPLSQVVVSGNTIGSILAANGIGIFVSPATSVSTQVIGDDSAGVVLSGNAVYQTGASGIEVSDAVGVSLVGNDVYLAGGIGIKVANAKRVGLHGNNVRNSGAQGVYVENTDGIVFTGNTSAKIPFSTTTMGAGLEFGPSVTNARIDGASEWSGGGAGKIGTPATVASLTATATLDFPSIPSKEAASLTMTVAGAASGDAVTIGHPASGTGGLMFSGYGSGLDTVTVRAFNPAASAVDAGAIVIRAIVHKVS